MATTKTVRDYRAELTELNSKGLKTQAAEVNARISILETFSDPDSAVAIEVLTTMDRAAASTGQPLVSVVRRARWAVWHYS